MYSALKRIVRGQTCAHVGSLYCKYTETIALRHEAFSTDLLLKPESGPTELMSEYHSAYIDTSNLALIEVRTKSGLRFRNQLYERRQNYVSDVESDGECCNSGS